MREPAARGEARGPYRLDWLVAGCVAGAPSDDPQGSSRAACGGPGLTPPGIHRLRIEAPCRPEPRHARARRALHHGLPGFVALALALCAIGAQSPATRPDAFEREWQNRSIAGEPERHAGAIDAALVGDWEARRAVLDALARSPAGVAYAVRGLAPRARALAHDPHPNVRAAAVRLLGALDDGSLLAVALEHDLARDSLPEVRRALARGLGRSGAPGAGPALLLGLARDPEPAVSEAARVELLTYGPAAAPEQLALIGNRDDEGPLLDALPYLVRSPVSPALVAELRRRVRAPGSAALVERLALHAGVDAERVVLVRGWFATGGTGAAADLARADARRGLMLSAVRAGDPELGRLLMQAGVELLAYARAPAAERRAAGLRFPEHAAGTDPALDPLADRASFLVECAAEALAPMDAIELARAFAASALPPLGLAFTEDVWRRVAPRVLGWDAARVRPWLSGDGGDLPGAPRFAVAYAVSESYLRGEAPELGALFAELLDDPDDVLRDAAFRWLCDAPDVERHLPALAAAWREYSPAERLARLRLLPRDLAPTPFRDDLLAMARVDDARTPAVVELLALFHGDAEVVESVGAWLAEELDALARGPGLQVFRRHELHAKGLLRAYSELRGVAAVPELERDLARAITLAPALAAGEVHSPELPKRFARELARTPEGRERLVAFLGEATPRRVRIEAGIWLVARPEGAARLLADYASCDSELRVRILDRLGRVEGDVTGVFLLRVGARPEGALEERIAALAALGRRGDVTRLAQAFAWMAEGARDLEARRAAVQYLGEVGGEGARRALESGLRARLALARAPLAGESETLLAAELFAALAEAGPIPADLVPECFRRPVESARADLERRFRGKKVPAAEFRWRAELALAERLAARGELAAALVAAGHWRRMDARLLAELGERAWRAGRSQWPLARELFTAALVGLRGEAPGEFAAQHETRVTLRLLELAEEAGRWDEFCVLCERLIDEQRRGTGSVRERERVLGTADARAGVDPRARLLSARAQARAWAALQRGDRAAARRWAEEGERHVGQSRAARVAQARLEAAMGG